MTDFIEEHRGTYGVEPMCKILQIARQPIMSGVPLRVTLIVRSEPFLEGPPAAARALMTVARELTE